MVRERDQWAHHNTSTFYSAFSFLRKLIKATPHSFSDLPWNSHITKHWFPLFPQNQKSKPKHNCLILLPSLEIVLFQSVLTYLYMCPKHITYKTKQVCVWRRLAKKSVRLENHYKLALCLYYVLFAGFTLLFVSVLFQII